MLVNLSIATPRSSFFQYASGPTAPSLLDALLHTAALQSNPPVSARGLHSTLRSTHAHAHLNIRHHTGRTPGRLFGQVGHRKRARRRSECWYVAFYCGDDVTIHNRSAVFPRLSRTTRCLDLNTQRETHPLTSLEIACAVTMSKLSLLT